MKINDTSRVGGVNPYRKANEVKSADQVAKKSRRDEVQISSEAKELLSQVQNSGRVEELKQAVQSGTYQVDSRKVAEKLLPYLL